MGTNYYVTLVEEDSDAHFDLCEYVSIDGSRTIRVASVHIGKSSYGWAFHFAGHKYINLTSFAEYKQFIRHPKRLILDEYGDVIDKEVFINMIEKEKRANFEYKAGMRNKDIISEGLNTPLGSLAHYQKMWRDEEGFCFDPSNFS